MLTLAPLAGCDGKAEPGAGFKPALLPVKFTVGPAGISIVGDSSIVTPIGEFSINAKYTLPGTGSDSIYVIIRDRARGRYGTDDIYEVRAGGDNFTAVVNGRTVIQVQDRRVTIDVTDGMIKEIEFAQVDPVASGAEPNVISSWWTNTANRWNNGWNSSVYKPFMLTRWAYDDSTITKGYGVGFVWFMVRLTLAVILAILDVLLSAVFLVGQIAYLFWGPTGRNIIWGLVAVPFFWLILVGGLGLWRRRRW